MNKEATGPEKAKATGEFSHDQSSVTIVPARHVLPVTLPVIPLGNRPLFPKMMTPMAIEEEPLKAMVGGVIQSPHKFVGLILMRNTPEPDRKTPVRPDELHSVGVVAEILQASQAAPEAPLQIMLGVMERFRVTGVLSESPHIVVTVQYATEPAAPEDEETKAYALAIITSIKELLQLNPLSKEELNLFLSRTSLKEPGRLADFSASMTSATGAELQEILEAFPLRPRMERALFLLQREIEISRMRVRISKQIEEKISKQQREFFLREQLKAIKKELGLSKEGKEADLEAFRKRLEKLTLPPEARERIEEEMAKLSVIEPHSPEFTVTRNYLDWLTSLPWGVHTSDRYDLRRAARILNADHYGLTDVKERILEFLAVGIRKGRISGSILCFIGPPGVGKTSIGQSIARSVGRKFYRFSLGGMRDEAEIKGHRRTYIGAMPGKFIQAIKVCKTANPVIMLDEIDKIGASFQGDPASALLEVLDPEQNRDFLDHYLDVRFDLSNVLFICTGNQTDTIPPPLLDRMEVIKLSGYILEEKLQIARRYLIPKQLKAHGLEPEHLKLPENTLRAIIDGYAREPGVRGLENHIKKLCRKAARAVVKDGQASLTAQPKNLEKLLGRRVYSESDPYGRPRPGVARGLAWTSLGGSVLYVEAARVEAEKPGFKQTGQLGQVMVESSEIAYTFVRSFLNDQPSARQFFSKTFIHLHVPAGATPKDGPSAGVTMAAALYSLAVNRPLRSDVAMTGELTLTGFVLPVGGIKEKAIAAKKAGVRRMILPKENRKDFEDIPPRVRKGLTPIYVETFADVVRAAFPPRPPSRGRRVKRAGA